MLNNDFVWLRNSGKLKARPLKTKFASEWIIQCVSREFPIITNVIHLDPHFTLVEGGLNFLFVIIS